jgi:hypothetical protein
VDGGGFVTGFLFALVATHPEPFLVAAAVTVALGRMFRKKSRRRRLYGFVGGLIAGKLSVGWAQRQRGRAPARPPLAGDDMWAACPLSRWGKTDRRLDACRACNGPLPVNRDRFCGPACKDWATDNHWFDAARTAARKRDGYACVKCRRTDRIEVNHIVPVLEQHKVPGCMHHLTGLETLCAGKGSCHQTETNRQRRNGEFNRRRSA